MRNGYVYRRCVCGHRYTQSTSRCPKCGSERFTWGYAVDISRPGARRRKQSFKTGFRTKSLANDALQDRLAEQRGGSYRQESRITVREFLDDWIESVAVEDVTQAGWRGFIRNQVGPRIGDIRLQYLETKDLRDFFAGLRVDGHQRTGGPLAEESIKRIHTMLSVAFKTAVPRLLPTNPATATLGSVRSISIPDTHNVWPLEDLRRFLLGVAMDRDYGNLYEVFLLLAMTGARRGEILGLTWAHVNGQKLELIQQRRRGVNGPVSGQPLKNRRGRSVKLDQATLAELSAHRDRQAKRLSAIGIVPSGATPVCDRGDGQPWDPDYVSKRFRGLVKEFKLPTLPLKNLRHTHATHLIARGAPINIVSERLGHADVSTTLRFYGHVLPGADEGVAEMFASLVGPLTGQARSTAPQRAGRGNTAVLDNIQAESLAGRALRDVLSTATLGTPTKVLRHGIAKFLVFCAEAGQDPERADLAVVDGPYAEWLAAKPTGNGRVLLVYARKWVHAVERCRSVAEGDDTSA